MPKPEVVQFPDGSEAEIKVCNDSKWIGAVLTDENGNQMKVIPSNGTVFSVNFREE